MASKIDVGEKLMEEIMNSADALRSLNHKEHGVDAVPIPEILKLAEAYSLVGNHFHHKNK